MSDYFFTPKGLKIRLNALFFIQELSKNNNMNEQSVSAIPAAVEILWQIPTALKYFFYNYMYIVSAWSYNCKLLYNSVFADIVRLCYKNYSTDFSDWIAV